MSSKHGKGKRNRAVTRKQQRTARLESFAATTVTVTFRHLDATDALRTYAERKLAHIGKYLKRACQVHLILSVDKYRQCGEVTVKSGRLSATAAEVAKDLYAVIDLLTDKVGRQLKRNAEKIQARKTRAPSTREVLSAVEES
jgi:putative sigma-54 modulation protein